jgi:hypothetical protein
VSAISLLQQDRTASSGRLTEEKPEARQKPTKILHPFDPSRIIKQKIWTDFIHDDCSILNRIRRGEYRHIIWPFIVIVLVIWLIVLDVQRHIWVGEVNAAVHEAMLAPVRSSKTLLDWFGVSIPPDEIVIDLVPQAEAIVGLVARILFQVLAVPFLVLSNFPLLFWQCGHLRKTHWRIFLVKIVGCVFFVLCLVAVIAGSILRLTLVFYKLPADFSYTPPSFRKVTDSPRPPICDVRIANMNIMKLVGLPLLPHSLNYSGSAGSTGLFSVGFDSPSRDVLRSLFSYLFSEEMPPTPVPSPMSDIPRTPICSSEKALCIFLYGKEDCSDVTNFSDAQTHWCRKMVGICDLVTMITGSNDGHCDLVVRKGIPIRGICDPSPAGVSDYFCGANHTCDNWENECQKFSFGCDERFHEAICGRNGFCATMNMSEKCSPMDRAVHIYQYRFQLEAQYVALGLNQFFLMSLTGFTSPQDIAIGVENVGTVWFHWLIATVVPFYRMVYGALLETVMGSLGQTTVQLVFGPNRMPLRFAKEAEGLAYVGNVAAYVREKIFGFNHRPLLIGHSHTAPAVKAVAMLKHSYALALEGPPYKLSPLDGFLAKAEPTEPYFIVNEASGWSWFAMEDPSAKWNYRMPDWQGAWQAANPYDTFCLLAAGCVDDDRYDAICHTSVGAERYREFFASWNRNRTA